MVSNDVNEIYTIDDLINLGKENSLNLENTNFLATFLDTNVIIPISNVLREHYRSCILRYCKQITLDDTAYEYYKFNPKKLSRDLYGGVELWHLLLWLNNLTTVIEFNLQTLLVLNPNYLDILNSILVKEEDNLYENRKNPIINLN